MASQETGRAGEAAWRSAGAPRSPLALLLPYQRAWVEDSSRWKIWLAARQIGKSFAAACEVVRHCHLHPRAQWIVLSAGERQALEFMEKVRLWIEACALELHDYALARASTEAVLKSAEARLANGSRILALPANPETARGYSANLVLDEFAFHQQSMAIWRAILPSIASPLRGELLVRVLSTPNGPNNAFHQLWTAGGGGADPESRGSNPATAWSRHRTTIHEACALGLGADLESLRRQLDDADGWAQEFECEFLDTAAVLLPYELMGPCESGDATETAPAEEPSPGGRPSAGPLYAGIDIGRKHDLTVLWLLRQEGGVLWTRGVRVLAAQPFHVQLETLAGELAKGRVSRCCVDATGLGAMLAEELARRLGAARVEGCPFSAAFKQELFPLLRRAFEDRSVRIPVSRAIREDLHALQKVTSASGQVSFAAARTAEGHCDRATALALALRAAREGPPPGLCRPFPNPRRASRALPG